MEATDPLGVASEVVSDLHALFRTGLYPACALSVRHQGERIVHRALGYEQGAPGLDDPSEQPVPVTVDTRFCLFSASKAVTAVLVHLLDDRGLLHIDDRIIEYIPEFGRHGKNWVTLRHLLSHRAGFPYGGGSGITDPEVFSDPTAILEQLYDAKLDARAGQEIAYLPISGGYILGEVIQRVTGEDVNTLLQREIAGPLGLSMQFGARPDELPTIARNYHTGGPGYRLVDWAARRAFGLSFPAVTAASNHPAFLSSVVPSGNLLCGVDDICRFFEMLRLGGELDGTRVLEHRTVQRLLNETSWGTPDKTLGFPLRYSVGLMLGGRLMSPYGPRTGRAFGHVGYSNILCWADRKRDLSVSLLTTGKPIIDNHLPRLWTLLSRLSDGYE